MRQLMFTKNNTHENTKNVVVDKTFCDSSSRTASLKTFASKGKKEKRKNLLDINGVYHQVQSLRNSGGIPKKCSLSSA